MSYSIFDYQNVSDDIYINYCNQSLADHGVEGEVFSLVSDSTTKCRYKITRLSDGLVRFFSYRTQSHGFTKGMAFVADSIRDAYFVGDIDINNNDIVVDVGANTGDLQLYLRLLHTDCVYVGIEPSPVEFECLRRNAIYPNDLFINAALGPFAGESDFFISSETGDSSLIMPRSFTARLKIRVLTLDSIVERVRYIYPSRRLRLLKLEAEGYEPEILEGAVRNISCFDYISADLGWERGVNQETTAPHVINFLNSNGFEIIDIGRRRMTVLFRNTRK